VDEFPASSTPNSGRVISLMTDFGLKDGNVGVMKGVISGIVSQVQIVDLSHLIQPQDIFEAALILSRSAGYFPPGTVHVIVVDPGVGTRRRPLAALLGKHFYVAPDNGVLTLVLEEAERMGGPVEVVCLDHPAYWLTQVSHVFHGRDIFAPVAAHLVKGVQLQEMGTLITDAVRLKIPEPLVQAWGWSAEVIHIDHFGNISTSLQRKHLVGREPSKVRLCGIELDGLVQTFGEKLPGTLVSLFGSTDYLIICEVNGNAAVRLGIHVGDPVEVLV
jgi:S-adenosylmethionine hydrolase